MLNLNTTYPAQSTGPNANYPEGEPQNVFVPGDGLGTPWEAKLVKDFVGFMQAAVTAAGVTITGAPETAVASDVLDALRLLLVQRSELSTSGGDVLVRGNALPRLHLDGLAMVRDSTALVTFGVGSARNLANTVDLILASALQKDISATWVSGAGGGLPDPLTLAANTWYRCITVGKADGSGFDITYEVSATATNFFVDANAIAAGYTDASRFRRFGWVRTNASSQIIDFVNDVADPRMFRWADQQQPINTTTIGNVSRTALALGSAAPPSVYAECGVFVVFGTDNHEVLITTADQDDVAVSQSKMTLRTENAPGDAEIISVWLTDASSQIFARRDDGSALNTFRVNVPGWRDPGLN